MIAASRCLAADGGSRGSVTPLELVTLCIQEGRPRDAVATLEKCPEDREVLFLKGVLYLGLKDWPRGWRFFHARHRPDETHHQAHLGIPAILNRRVVLYQEAGLGDTLQFMRWAPLIHQYASSLTVLVREPLYRLMRLLRIPATVTNWSIDGAVNADDCLLGVLDAPLVFNHGIDQIPRHDYLKPIASSARDGLTVGLVWAGGIRDRRRSIEFGYFQRLIYTFPQITFVSLQQPDFRVDCTDLQQPVEDDFDLLDTAMIIGGLDLVISIDTSVAHLAATMGKPVWLLCLYDCCWRWFWDNSTTTPWYPTMRVYRQPAQGDWESVITAAARDLAALNGR
jgi:hypothetical protein